MLSSCTRSSGVTIRKVIQKRIFCLKQPLALTDTGAHLSHNREQLLAIYGIHFDLKRIRVGEGRCPRASQRAATAFAHAMRLRRLRPCPLDRLIGEPAAEL